MTTVSLGAMYRTMTSCLLLQHGCLNERTKLESKILRRRLKHKGWMVNISFVYYLVSNISSVRGFYVSGENLLKGEGLIRLSEKLERIYFSAKP